MWVSFYFRHRHLRDVFGGKHEEPINLLYIGSHLLCSSESYQTSKPLFRFCSCTHIFFSFFGRLFWQIFLKFSDICKGSVSFERKTLRWILTSLVGDLNRETVSPCKGLVTQTVLNASNVDLSLACAFTTLTLSQDYLYKVRLIFTVSLIFFFVCILGNVVLTCCRSWSIWIKARELLKVALHSNRIQEPKLHL